MPPSTPVPIVVFAGQSNANNTGSINAIFDRVAQNSGLLVQAALNGSPLASSTVGSDWSAGAVTGELLLELYDLLDPLFDPSAPDYISGAYLDAVIWSQGGADVYFRTYADNYQTNLLALMSALQGRYGTHDFVISGLADSSLIGRGLTGQLAANWQTIQQAQQNLAALPYVLLLDPDDVATDQGYSPQQMYQWDYIHYRNAGFSAALGTALVDLVLPSGTAGANYLLGTAAGNLFGVQAAGLTQVFGDDGVDRLVMPINAPATLLIDQGFSTSRLLDKDGTSSFHIDMISIEIVRLTNHADEARLGGAVSTVFTLGGGDKVIGSDAAEVAFLGNGNDYAALLAGNDYANGGNGRDTILGGKGDDRLIGGNGDDVLNGGAGDDRLTGGRGADQFIFEANQGHDTITDFQRGWDHLVLDDATWSDVTITAQGRNTQIAFQDTTITLLNVAAQHIDIDDFIFR